MLNAATFNVKYNCNKWIAHLGKSVDADENVTIDNITIDKRHEIDLSSADDLTIDAVINDIILDADTTLM